MQLFVLRGVRLRELFLRITWDTGPKRPQLAHSIEAGGSQQHQ